MNRPRFVGCNTTTEPAKSWREGSNGEGYPYGQRARRARRSAKARHLKHESGASDLLQCRAAAQDERPAPPIREPGTLSHLQEDRALHLRRHEVRRGWTPVGDHRHRLQGMGEGPAGLLHEPRAMVDRLSREQSRARPCASRGSAHRNYIVVFYFSTRGRGLTARRPYVKVSGLGTHKDERCL